MFSFGLSIQRSVLSSLCSYRWRKRAQILRLQSGILNGLPAWLSNRIQLAKRSKKLGISALLKTDSVGRQAVTYRLMRLDANSAVDRIEKFLAADDLSVLAVRTRSCSCFGITPLIVRHCRSRASTKLIPRLSLHD